MTQLVERGDPLKPFPNGAIMALGELMSKLYKEYLERYNDSDMAAVATAASINEMLSREQQREQGN